MDTAYFVKQPRRLEELRTPHMLEQERRYELAARVTLNAVDYENFISDMLADRGFIEDAAGVCGEGEPMKCLLVRRRGGRDGVLVVPEGAFVKFAALFPMAQK